MNQSTQRVHFIAIGGAAMHNLALALQKKGLQVTGSDDEIFEPSKSRLAQAGLLPTTMGWDAAKITPEVSFVIVGMHAKADNPELIKAKELGLPVYSYPEYIFEHAKEKHRVVIAGSHGKTTITSIIMHVLAYHERDFDYMVGSKLPNFDTMVRLTNEAPIMIIEGDEYPASPLDPRPKFLVYNHHVALVSGIAWDHMNVYPSFDQYIRQFDHLADTTPKAGALIYNEEDSIAEIICKKERTDVAAIPYDTHQYEVIGGKTFLYHKNKPVPVQVFGKHNMSNIAGAKAVCSRLGITEDMFYAAISTFTGAANRLETLGEGLTTAAYRDFAHAPSKVKATIDAVKEQNPERRLVAVLELHTFSSLSKSFIPEYRAAMAKADIAYVYFNPEVLAHKNLESLDPAWVAAKFQLGPDQVITDSNLLFSKLRSTLATKTNLLLMSSGDFSGQDLKQLAQELIGKG